MISQVNIIYVMDIVWILCDVYVWSSKFIFSKAFLRICYISLFECKGPWMLKTVKVSCVEQRITKLD